MPYLLLSRQLLHTQSLRILTQNTGLNVQVLTHMLTQTHRYDHISKSHPSMHLLPLIRAGSWGQQSKQGCPDFPLPRHFLQLFQGDPEAFPGQPSGTVPPACPGSSPGPLPSGACLEHPPRKVLRRHPTQIPEPPQPALLDAEEQRLYPEL